MPRPSRRSKERARRRAAVRLVAPKPSDVCLICGEPLKRQQERFCKPLHRHQWHAKARDIGEFVMETMRELIGEKK